MAEIDAAEKDEIKQAFDEAVNMTPHALEAWLKTEESREVGWKEDGDGESVGHASGRKIIAIKHKKKADLDQDDYKHMQKVAGYVRRHLAQGGPDSDKEDSRWRYSLMNWGCDPLKK